MSVMKTILTGIKPTGEPHLGNLAGAILPAIEFSQNNSGDQYLYFIADYHSLTGARDAKTLRHHTYEIAACWLAFGLDPDKVLFYRQSDVPEILELNWILSCLTPKGDMNRAHAYKAMVEQAHAEGKDPDKGVNIGLFTYPVLMAADILMFKTHLVPVGKDQVQHVEIARSIAQRFNQYYGDVLVEPEAFLREDSKSLKGLDGRKMSKSYGNTIPIFSESKKLKKLINKLTTDSTPPGEPKSTEDSLIFDLYQAFGTEEECDELALDYQNGISWGEAKAKLFDLIDPKLEKPREIFTHYMSRTELIDELLLQGASKARAIAGPLLADIKKAIGIL